MNDGMMWVLIVTGGVSFFLLTKIDVLWKQFRDNYDLPPRPEGDNGSWKEKGWRAPKSYVNYLHTVTMFTCIFVGTLGGFLFTLHPFFGAQEKQGPKEIKILIIPFEEDENRTPEKEEDSSDGEQFVLEDGQFLTYCNSTLAIGGKTRA